MPECASTPKGHVAEFDIMFGDGISRTGDVLDVATSSGIVTKRGTFFYYGEDKLGQGRENAKDYLKSNPEVMEQIAADQDARRIWRIACGGLAAFFSQDFDKTRVAVTPH